MDIYVSIHIYIYIYIGYSNEKASLKYFGVLLSSVSKYFFLTLFFILYIYIYIYIYVYVAGHKYIY